MGHGVDLPHGRHSSRQGLARCAPQYSPTFEAAHHLPRSSERPEATALAPRLASSMIAIADGSDARAFLHHLGRRGVRDRFPSSATQSGAPQLGDETPVFRTTAASDSERRGLSGPLSRS